jgi:hypothetical protein
MSYQERVAGDWDLPTLPPVSDDELPLCGVQGYCPRVYRAEQGQDRFRRPYDCDGPALPVAPVVALIGTWWDAVTVILLSMDGVPLRVIGPSVRISAVALSSLVSNAQHVNVMGTRLLVVTCWP